MTGDALLWVNGQLVSTVRARVDPRDRGFTLGDGLFETMRAVGGTLPRIELHLARLRASAASIGLPIPWKDGELLSVVIETLVANDLDDGIVRLTVSRGVPTTRGLLPDPQPIPSLVVYVQPFIGYPAELYARGVRAITSPIIRNERSPLASVKTLSSLENVLARRGAAACGVDEAILCNTIGHIACASAANLFIVTENAIVTPSIESGALRGTTREVVLTELAPRLGLSISNRAIPKDELARSNEAFLTNVLLGAMPLTVVDGRSIGSGTPGPISQLLNAKLMQLYDGATANKDGCT